jgi:hypothetical protein
VIGDKKTSRAVLESAYISAVVSVLVQIFHVDGPHALKEVAVWWGRMAGTSAFRSGVFLHDGPLRTAAEIHGAPEPELSEHEQLVYRAILETSLSEAQTEARSESKPRRLWELDELKQPSQSVELASPQEAPPMKRLAAGAGR